MDSAAAQPGSAGLGWETELTAGVHLTERDEREPDQLGRHEQKRKTYFCGDAIDTWARWATRRRLRPTREGRPAGLAGPKAKWAGKASRAESEK
jgi:hypothetical protein